MNEQSRHCAAADAMSRWWNGRSSFSIWDVPLATPFRSVPNADKPLFQRNWPRGKWQKLKH